MSSCKYSCPQLQRVTSEQQQTIDRDFWEIPYNLRYLNWILFAFTLLKKIIINTHKKKRKIIISVVCQLMAVVTSSMTDLCKI